MNSSPFYCTRCGAANPVDADTCFACGYSLQAAAAQLASAGDYLPEELLHGRYHIINQVGTGGYGAVYRAKDTQSGDRLVAIKQINLRGLTPQEAIEATDGFNREIALLSGLNHPNLPHVYDHFTDPEHWYLVMDFIEGETLEDHLKSTRDGSLPLESVLNIGIQLCTVLDYLHTRQPPIIFRDLKPANIMRTPGGHLYLIDFGTARHLKPGQARDTIALGSPGYAAPEQYGKSQTNQQADIYSLAATLHHLLTGDDPSENPFNFATLHSTHAEIPSELETLVKQMLDIDANKRPASVKAVKEQLQIISTRHSRTLYALQTLSASQAPSSPHMASSMIANQAAQQISPFPVKRNPLKYLIQVGLVLLVVLGTSSFCVLSTSLLVRHEVGGIDTTPLRANPAPASQQVFRGPLIGTSSTGSSFNLDPALAADAQSMQAVGMIFTGLFSLDDSLNARPQLVSSYAVSSDRLTWTFNLRPNLKFSDGTPLTSNDVAYSIDRALQPATRSAQSMAYLGLIKDAEKLHAGLISTIIGDSLFTPDDNTVIIRLSKPAAYFLTALAYPCSYVVEKSLVEKYGDQHFADHLTDGGGDGPFHVSQYIHNQEIDFVPNPNYYDPVPQLSKVIFPFFKDVEASFQAYQVGHLDFTDIPFADLDQARQNSDLRTIFQPTISYYAMNYLVKPFDNIHIRQAFALAINKDLIVSVVWKGSIMATNHIIPRGIPGFNPFLLGPHGTASTSGDQIEARNLMMQGLQEEGWSSVVQLPPITFTYANTSPSTGNEAITVQQMWRSVLGVNVNIHAVAASTLQREISASANNPQGLQFWASNWSADYPDPREWMTLQFAHGSPHNTVNYGQNVSPEAANQQAVQQQLESADSNPEPISRIQAYQALEQQLVNDVVWLPVYQAEQSYELKSFVYGWHPNSVGLIPPDEWANIYITAN